MTEPTTILLIRHGTTPTTGQVLPGRAPGLELAPAGVNQARRVAAWVSQVDAIYTSPLERTQLTAQPLAQKFGMQPRLHEGLVECDFGDWTGAKLTDLAKLDDWKIVQNSPQDFRFPNGESFVEMQDRMITALTDIARDHPEQTVACFSHADPIKAAIVGLDGTGWQRFQKVALDTGSMSVLDYDGTWQVDRVNVRP